MIPLKDDNPTTHAPILTIILIAVNLVVYLWQISAGPIENLKRDFRYAAVPQNVVGHDGDPAVRVVVEMADGGIQVKQLRRREAGLAVDSLNEIRRAGSRVSLPRNLERIDRIDLVEQPWPAWLTLLSSMFMHGSWMHLLGNMLFLWVFGNNVEDATRHLRFLIFYLGTGLCASLAHVFSDTSSMIPSLGASGAISGVLGGYLVLYPRARVLALVPIPPVFLTSMRLPAAIFLVIWFVIQLSGLFGQDGGVAWWAHLGGFVAGVALIKLLETSEHRKRTPEFEAPRGFSRMDRPW